jgi:hypothetical protein
MIRNLKVLGLALVAVFAMSAMVASAASAAQFTSAQSTTTLTGEEVNGQTELLVTGTGIKCSEVSFHAHVSSTAVGAVTATPTYTGCLTSIGSTATVTGFGDHGEENTCDYLIDADGTADLVCDPGAEVTIDASTCVVHIPAQNNIGTIGYETGLRNGVHDLTLKINITSIAANHTDGFLCPMNGGSGNASSATLKGDVTVWGEDPVTGAPVGITHDPT